MSRVSHDDTCESFWGRSAGCHPRHIATTSLMIALVDRDTAGRSHRSRRGGSDVLRSAGQLSTKTFAQHPDVQRTHAPTPVAAPLAYKTHRALRRRRRMRPRPHLRPPPCPPRTSPTSPGFSLSPPAAPRTATTVLPLLPHPRGSAHRARPCTTTLTIVQAREIFAPSWQPARLSDGPQRPPGSVRRRPRPHQQTGRFVSPDLVQGTPAPAGFGKTAHRQADGHAGAHGLPI